MFNEEDLLWDPIRLVAIIHSLLSVLIFLHFIITVGQKIKSLLENVTTSPLFSTKGCESKALESMVMSFFFFALGITVCMLLRGLYLSSLAHQEGKIVEEVSRQVLHKQNNLYGSISVDWPVVLYSSFINTVFLLTFSWPFAILNEFVQQEIKQQLALNKNESEKTASAKYMNV